MDRNDILKYLELDASASIAAVQAGIEEKLRKLDALSDSMDSDFLQRMHKKNVDKALDIKKEVMLWTDRPAAPNPASLDDRNKALNEIPVAEVAGKADSAPLRGHQQYDNHEGTAPVIIGSRSKAYLSNAAEKEPLGWLVRHTENQTAVTFTIFAGKNYLGRKKQTGLSTFIVIDDDVYISRVHAVIEAVDAAEFEFYISDNESSNLGKPSKNGTYINGDEKRISQKVRFFENDTVQVGVTKMILKVNKDNNLKKVIKEVQGSKFMDTVIIDADLRQ